MSMKAGFLDKNNFSIMVKTEKIIWIVFWNLI